MGSEAAASGAEESLQGAHARLTADESLQFSLKPTEPPDPPAWLDWIEPFLRFVAPFLQYVFWAGLIAVVGLIVFYIGREILRRGRPDRIADETAAGAVDLTPRPERARALLDDADRLAAEGRYAEAVHLLLLRSVGDIEALRPATVRPSMTSRDIARLDLLPAAARTAFVRIAEVVERSFFGGRDVDSMGYDQCRAAYEAFAFPKAWA